MSSCYARIKDFDFIVVITGFGSSGQYDEVDKLFAEDSMLSKLADQIREKHANWVVVFGGDKYHEDKPDVAHVRFSLFHAAQAHWCPRWPTSCSGKERTCWPYSATKYCTGTTQSTITSNSRTLLLAKIDTTTVNLQTIQQNSCADPCCIACCCPVCGPCVCVCGRYYYTTQYNHDGKVLWGGLLPWSVGACTYPAERRCADCHRTLQVCYLRIARVW